MNLGFFTSWVVGLGLVGPASIYAEFADRPSVGCRLAFGGTESKSVQNHVPQSVNSL